MIQALVCCRAGMGSSLLLKIKVDQVIKENHFDIVTEHGNLDSLIGYKGNLVITMEDLTEELSNKGYCAIGIRNIVDKEEIKSKIRDYLTGLNQK